MFVWNLDDVIICWFSSAISMKSSDIFIFTDFSLSMQRNYSHFAHSAKYLAVSSVLSKFCLMYMFEIIIVDKKESSILNITPSP